MKVRQRKEGSSLSASRICPSVRRTNFYSFARLRSSSTTPSNVFDRCENRLARSFPSPVPSSRLGWLASWCTGYNATEEERRQKQQQRLGILLPLPLSLSPDVAAGRTQKFAKYRPSHVGRLCDLASSKG